MLSDYFEDFALLACQRIPDGLGGMREQWTEAGRIRLGVAPLRQSELRGTAVNESQAVCHLLHGAEVSLHLGVRVRRLRDGAVFRITDGAGTFTPQKAVCAFGQVSAKRMTSAEA